MIIRSRQVGERDIIINIMYRRLLISLYAVICMAVVYSQTCPITPYWALGHIVWEDSLNSSEGTLRIVDGYLEHNIKVDGVIIDSPWSTSYNDFNYDAQRYPDPQLLLSELRDRSVKPIIWITGIVNDSCTDVPINRCPNYDEVVLNNYGVNNNTPSYWWKGRGIHIDFTNQDAVNYWKMQMDKVFGDGIYGFKIDQGERYFGDSIDTSIGRLSNEEFRPYYYDAIYDYVTSCKSSLGVTLARPYSNQGSGFFASVDKMSLGWCGDFSGNWNGLSGQIKNIYKSAEAGYGAIGCEIGGFLNAHSSEAQLIRYAQFASMTGCMINGGSNGAFSNHLAWWHSEEAEKIYRFTVSLHQNLRPYIFSTLVECHQNGGSLIRSTSSRQSDLHHMLGESLFVRPIVDDEGEVSVVLPEDGGWTDFFTGDTYSAGATVSRKYELGEFPLFIKTGSVIPMEVSDTITGFGNQGMSGRRVFLFNGLKDSFEKVFHLPEGEGVEFFDFTLTYDSIARTISYNTLPNIPCTFIIMNSPADYRADDNHYSVYDDVKHRLIIETLGGADVSISLKDITTGLRNQSVSDDEGDRQYSIDGRQLPKAVKGINISRNKGKRIIK